MLTRNNIIDPSLGQRDDPLDGTRMDSERRVVRGYNKRERESAKNSCNCVGYDMCFRDFIERVGDVEAAEQSLNREILEFNPPCKVKEYPLFV